MNYLGVGSPELSWPEVTRAQFEDILASFYHMQRMGYADALVYRDKSGRVFAIEVSKGGRILVHPSLAAEVANNMQHEPTTERNSSRQGD